MVHKLNNAVAANYNRFLNYIGVWYWLVKRNIAAAPKVFAITIFFGICSRFGMLISFFLTIRCATWILNPDLISRIADKYLPAYEHSLILILVAVPGVAFGASAIAQLLYNFYALNLRNEIAEYLAAESAKSQLTGLSTEELGDRILVTKIAADMRLGHGKLVAIEAMLVNLIVIGSVLLLIFIGGMFVDWFLMGVITSIGLVFALLTAGIRHTSSHDITEKQEEARLSEQSQIKAIAGVVDETASLKRNREAVGNNLTELVGTMSEVKSINQQFNNKSSLILDLGQAVIIVSFLILLSNNEVKDQSQISLLIILVILLRFLVSYLQTAVHTVIKLSPHYPYLSQLRRQFTKIVDPATVESNT